VHKDMPTYKAKATPAPDLELDLELELELELEYPNPKTYTEVPFTMSTSPPTRCTEDALYSLVKPTQVAVALYLAQPQALAPVTPAYQAPLTPTP